MIEIFMDAVIDCIKLIPFLWATYFVMEWIEHKTTKKSNKLVQRAGKFAPIIGSALGVFPQCGFSAAAANLYAGRMISLGTMLAIFLSTSDEMLPIFISEAVAFSVMVKILVLKFVMGAIAGIILDFFIKRELRKKTLVQQDHLHCCHFNHMKCGHLLGTCLSALLHTLQIAIFLFIVTLGLNILIALVGKNNLAGLWLNQPIIGEMIAGLIGLIPNCAASVMITQLYLEGAMSVGALFSGLLTGAGIGLLVLFRRNHSVKRNIQIVILLYGIGVFCGIMIEALGIVL